MHIVWGGAINIKYNRPDIKQKQSKGEKRCQKQNTAKHVNVKNAEVWSQDKITIKNTLVNQKNATNKNRPNGRFFRINNKHQQHINFLLARIGKK